MNPVEQNSLILLELMRQEEEDSFTAEWLVQQSKLTARSVGSAASFVERQGAAQLARAMGDGPADFGTLFLKPSAEHLYYKLKAQQAAESGPGRTDAAPDARPRLLISRDEIVTQLGELIKEGQKLPARLSRGDWPKLKKTQEQYEEWWQYCVDLLDRSFDNYIYRQEFELAHGPIIMGSDSDYDLAVQCLRDDVNAAVSNLRSLTRRLKLIPEPEAAPRLSPTALETETVTSRRANERPSTRLLVPEPEAIAKIQATIDRGNQTRAMPIVTQADAVKCDQETQKWHRYNSELLRSVFSSDDLAHDLGPVPFIHAATASRFLSANAIKQLHRNVDRELTVLEGIVERIEFYRPLEVQEPAIVLSGTRGEPGESQSIPQTGGLDESDWEHLLQEIKGARCVPFLGAGASYGAVPLGGDIAEVWANEHAYPFPNRRDLVAVAQYLAVKHHAMYPKDEILLRWFTGLPDPDLQPTDEPHDVLAELPLPMYLTTNYDPFMVKALVRRNRDPQRELCRWNPLVEDYPSAFDDPSFRLHAARPVVYHLHGHDESAASLVLTESDYLQFLVALARNPDRIPKPVRASLQGGALLFIGYSLVDMTFRTLFEGLISEITANIRRPSFIVQRPVTADQVLPGGADGAQGYLEKYYGSLGLRVYWGTAREFAKELRVRWRTQEGR